MGQDNVRRECNQFCRVPANGGCIGAGPAGVDLLRADNFDAFMADRQARLLRLIEQAIGQAAYHGEMADEDAETEGETAEAVLTMAAAA
ncbi:MAG: hypothetical protein WBE93_27820 [Pseudolabrys sp.]|jgi:hypothetical protein